MVDSVSLEHVTELHVSLVNDSTLGQLAAACKNLQRLCIKDCTDTAYILEGLRAIALHCPDLCGLNLSDIGVSMVTDCHIPLWEILSGMKLTHLCLETCAVFGLDSNEQLLAPLFQKCSSLQALQIQHITNDYCEWCLGMDCKVNWSLLSHFPALKYCRMTMKHSTAVMDVINFCKQLKIATFLDGNESAFLSSVSTSSLQQLSIDNSITSIPDIFMETVSAHGGLLHVIFIVESVSNVGITSLVRNSPNLLTCLVNVKHIITHDRDTMRT